MIDEMLIQKCDKVLADFNKSEELESEGQDLTGQSKEIMSDACSIIQSVIDTAALTLAGCAAKAALYLHMQHEGLAMSLAGDIIALASAATQLLAA